MNLTLCLIAAACLAVDVCVWHGPVDRLLRNALQPQQTAVATVHGQTITAADLDNATQADCFRRGQNWATMDEPARDTARKLVLVKLMDGALIRAARLAEATSLHPAKGVDEELRLFIKQFPEETEFPERLAMQHLTEVQLRERMQAALDDQAWIEKQIEAQLAKVTEDEAHAWFARHKAELTVPESFHAAHVFLSGHAKNEADNPDHTADIQAMHQKLVSGATTLEDLARTASEDDRTKAGGGDLGWFTRNRMPADFMAAVTSLSPGQLSPPVHTKLGWHVIKLIEKKPARIPSFEEVHDEVLEMLRNQRREEAEQSLLVRLRQN